MKIKLGKIVKHVVFDTMRHTIKCSDAKFSIKKSTYEYIQDSILDTVYGSIEGQVECEIWQDKTLIDETN